jgi:hypothetical protein
VTEFVRKRPETTSLPLIHKPFTAPQRGRPPRYCSAGCRLRAYEKRLPASQVEAQLPLRLLARDIVTVQGQDEFRRRVVEVLRERRLLPPAPRGPPRTPLCCAVKDGERQVCLWAPTLSEIDCQLFGKAYLVSHALPNTSIWEACPQSC